MAWLEVLLVVWLGMAGYLSRVRFGRGAAPWLRKVGVIGSLVTAAVSLLDLIDG